MHGRPRPKKGAAEDPAKIKKQKQRAELYGKLAAEVLGRRATGQMDPESLKLSEKLLELNPEVYTVWNYRREALSPVLDGSASEAAHAAMAGELALTQRALAVNPKSYVAWHHRTWVVERGSADLQQELALVQRLLVLDSRNFHGWAYWRWLVGRMGLPSEECLAYTSEKLRANFSNYSAWHARTALLAAAHAPPPAVPTLSQLMAEEAADKVASPPAGTALPAPLPVSLEVLDREFELVHRAFWTEPRDQSAWLYHRWLLGSCLAAAGVTDTRAAAAGSESPAVADQQADASALLAAEGSAAADTGSGPAASAEPATASGGSTRAGGDAGREAAVDALRSRLDTEAAMCEELLQEEPQAKWPLLMLTWLGEAKAALERPLDGGDRRATAAGEAHQEAAGEAAGNDMGDGNGVAAKQQSQPASSAIGSNDSAARYRQLAELDPLRSGFYFDSAAGNAHVVLRATVS